MYELCKVGENYRIRSIPTIILHKRLWECSNHENGIVGHAVRMANLKGKDLFQELCLVEGIVMKGVLKKKGWKDLGWINLAQVCMSTEVRLPNPVKIWGISEVADSSLVSQKELCSIEPTSEINNTPLNQRRSVAEYCLQEEKTPLPCMRRICVAVGFTKRTCNSIYGRRAIRWPDTSKQCFQIYLNIRGLSSRNFRTFDCMLVKKYAILGTICNTQEVFGWNNHYFILVFMQFPEL